MRKNRASPPENFKRKLIKEVLNIPYDVTHNLLLSWKDDIYDKYPSTKRSMCPKCLTPRIVGATQTRLSSYPRNASAVKCLMKRLKAGRASRKERALIAASREKQNVLVMRCNICHYEVIKRIKIPHKDNDSEEPLKEEFSLKRDNETIRKPKKKKKKKETNAGLNIPKEFNPKPTVREGYNKTNESNPKAEFTASPEPEHNLKKKQLKKQLDLSSLKTRKIDTNEIPLKRSSFKQKKNSKLKKILSLNHSTTDNRPKDLDSFLRALI